jgi:histidine triad (HIT) family protein
VAADDCIFCKIIAGELPAEKLDEDEDTLSFMDINPWTRGHALVIPKHHVTDIHEISEESLAKVLAAARRLAGKARDNLGADGINVLNSAGQAAWQTVFHFHVHVIPRYEGDPLRLPGQPMQPGEGELAQVAAELRG